MPAGSNTFVPEQEHYKMQCAGEQGLKQGGAQVQMQQRTMVPAATAARSGIDTLVALPCDAVVLGCAR